MASNYNGGYNVILAPINYTPTLNSVVTPTLNTAWYFTANGRLTVDFLIAISITSTATQIRIGLPPNHAINTSYLPTSGTDNVSVSWVGTGQWFETGAAFKEIDIVYVSTVSVGLIENPGLLTGNLVAAGDSLKGRFEVPYINF